MAVVIADKLKSRDIIIFKRREHSIFGDKIRHNNQCRQLSNLLRVGLVHPLLIKSYSYVIYFISYIITSTATQL